MDTYSQFIHLSRYSRYLETEGRRETWNETVDRVMKFWTDRIDNNVLTEEEANNLNFAVTSMQVMPSMRAMWSAGDALDKNNFRGYNCSFAEVNHIRVFDEILYILMAGTGVGFSCENKHTSKLPIINDTFNTTERTITIEDSIQQSFVIDSS